MTLHTDPSEVAKQILPAGFTDCTHGGPLANFNWRKRHGFGGAGMIERALKKAFALGFVFEPNGCFNTPDGIIVVGYKGKMHHPDGWELEHHSSYGCVAYDNSFSMSLKQVQRSAIPA